MVPHNPNSREVAELRRYVTVLEHTIGTHPAAPVVCRKHLVYWPKEDGRTCPACAYEKRQEDAYSASLNTYDDPLLADFWMIVRGFLGDNVMRVAAALQDYQAAKKVCDETQSGS